jgi:hypothetical protein
MIQELSSYSTERYYLLSELEQKFQMRFLDEAPPSPKNDSQTSIAKIVSPLHLVYKLWIYGSCPLSDLMTNIITLLDSIQKPLDTVTLCMVIDIFLPSGKKLEGDLYNQVKSILSHELFLRYGDCPVVIGAFDNAAACPGLEFCFHCAQQISPGYSSDDMVGLLIAQSRSEMLGAEPDREPDAVNEVYQVYCTHEADGVESFLHRFAKDFGQKKPSSPSKQFSNFPPLVLIVLLFALIFAFLPVPVDSDWNNWNPFA